MTSTNTPIQFTDHQLVEGLSNANAPVLQYLFREIAPLVASDIKSMGGTAADAKAFFKAAIVDAAQMARQSGLPEAQPLPESVRDLARHHFSSWTATNTPPASEAEPGTEPIPVEETPTATWLPDETALEQTRHHIQVWKTLNKLKPECRNRLLDYPEEDSGCKTEFAMALNLGHTPTEMSTWPPYIAHALARKTDYGIWNTLRQYEHYSSQGLNLDGTPIPHDNRILKYAFLMFGLMTLGYFLYGFFNQPKPAGEIFNQNFAPPQSLAEDMNKRFENDTSGVFKPERCNELFQAADQYYGEKNYSAANDLLLQMLDNDELDACRSDALFGLAIISLKQDEPGDALQYLAKIDNIEAYGEDLYWYQALAFVQMAKQESAYRRPARGAMERFLENTRNEQRRQQGQIMLNELE